jgi:Uma2 family endonuclease
MNMLLSSGFSIVKMPRDFRPMTDDEFFYYCQENPDHKFERDADGTIIVMGQPGGETGNRNSELNADLTIWNRSAKLGFVFDSSTGFLLPSSAVRSPDAAWVAADRWNVLSADERKKFPPLCPDFVVELMSESDSRRMAEDKMREYIDNGCRLAWLIDPRTETVRIYRADGSVKVIQGFDNTLPGEDVLPGFAFELKLLR